MAVYRQKRQQGQRRKDSLTVLNENDSAIVDKIKRYCSEICEGKCCHVWKEKKKIAACPKLKEDKTCSIYRQRYLLDISFSFNYLDNSNGSFSCLTARCGSIHDLLKDPTFPSEIKAECCYAHPELLEQVK